MPETQAIDGTGIECRKGSPFLRMMRGYQLWAFWPGWEANQTKGLRECVEILPHEPSQRPLKPFC